MPTNIHIVKAMVFPVVMYGCECWTIKVKHERIDAFELWCWRRLLRVPWSARRQSVLKEINPEYSLEGLMLKLKLQYFDHLMWRADSLERTSMLGKIAGRRRGGKRGWDGWMASPTQGTWVWAISGERVKDREACCAAVHGVSMNQTWLKSRTGLMKLLEGIPWWSVVRSLHSHCQGYGFNPWSGN